MRTMILLAILSLCACDTTPDVDDEVSCDGTTVVVWVRNFAYGEELPCDHDLKVYVDGALAESFYCDDDYPLRHQVYSGTSAFAYVVDSAPSPQNFHVTSELGYEVVPAWHSVNLSAEECAAKGAVRYVSVEVYQ